MEGGGGGEWAFLEVLKICKNVLSCYGIWVEWGLIKVSEKYKVVEI